jgi:hypothetical protein
MGRQDFNNSNRGQQFDLRNNLNQGREQQNRVLEDQRKREAEMLERERQTKMQEDLKQKGTVIPEEIVQSGVAGTNGGTNAETRNLGREVHPSQFVGNLQKQENKYSDAGCNRCGLFGHKSDECK